MTSVGQKSIMHIILIYELIAKVLRIKADQIEQNPKSQKEKLCKEKEKLKNYPKKKKIYTKIRRKV